jgi:hypothetical protein
MDCPNLSHGIVMNGYMNQLLRRHLSVPIIVFCLAATELLAQPTLQITSPATGTVVRPGQTLTVKVTGSGAVFTQVGLLPEDPLIVSPEVLTAPPYEFTITIPMSIQARH